MPVYPWPEYTVYKKGEERQASAEIVGWESVLNLKVKNKCTPLKNSPIQDSLVPVTEQ